MKRFLPLILLMFFAFSSGAQIAKPGSSSGKKRSKKSAPAGPKKLSGKSIILVVMDADGTLEVDFEKIWDFKKGDTWKSPIAAGEHVIKFYNEIASWERTVTNKSGQQQIVNAKLQPEITAHNLQIQREEEERLAAEREAKRNKEEAERRERERKEKEARDAAARAKYLREKPIKDWEKATSQNTMESYKRYRSEQPNGKYFEEAGRRMAELDEDAYDRATTEGTQASLRYYLSNYPLGQYRNQVQTKLDERVETDVYDKARKSNILEDYEAYEARYPSGKYINIVRETIQKGYLSLGDRAFAKKRGSKSSNQEAEKFYAKYVSRYPSGPEVGLARKKLNKVQSRLKRLGRPNRWGIKYLWDHDPYDGMKAQTYIGLGLEFLNNRSIGFLMHVRMNEGIFRTGTYWTVDDQGNDDGAVGNVVGFTGRHKQGRLDALVGLTYNPVFPLWVYLSGGVGHYPTFSRVNYSLGGSTEKVWVKNTDRTFTTGLMEFGLILDLWGFNLSLGVCTEGFKRAYPTFGVGFTVKRY